MIRSLCFALVAFAFTSVAHAQAPLEPPGIAEPSYWQVHDDGGYMGLDILVEYAFYDPHHDADVYTLFFSGVVNGQPVSIVSYLWDDGSGGPLVVWNSDSGNVTEWHWEGDHYVKVGGTYHYREFHPVF